MTISHKGVGVDIIAPIHDALKDRGVFLVGGQAVWLWAELYLERAPELEEYKPFTSLDIDFFGVHEVAKLIADDMGGTLITPESFSNTPSSAIILFEHEGQEVQIDFINSVFGINQRELFKHVDELSFKYCIDGCDSILTIPTMTPYACLVSRVANRLGPLKRKDDRGMSQLQVSPIVLREYLLEMVESESKEDLGHVYKLTRCLHWFLRRDKYGRSAHTVLENDPLDILIMLANDDRLDLRFRDNQILPFIEDIDKVRQRISSLST